MAASNILETFFILFDTNADKLKKGNEDAKESSRDLETSLTATDRAGQVMGEHLVATLKTVGLAFVAAFAFDRIKDEIFEVGEFTDALGKSAKRLGVSIEFLDTWEEATKRAGGSTGEFTQTLDFLNKGMADIAVKGKSRLSPFFDELKIKVTDAGGHIKPFSVLLGDLADKLSKMSAQEAAGYGEKLGLNQGTLLLLVQGRRAVEDLVNRQKELGAITQEDADIAERFNDQWDDTKQIFRNIAAAIGSALFPAFADFLKLVEHIAVYLRQHKGLIEGFFVGIAGVITAIFLPAVIEAAVATLLFLGPWLLIGAAIVGALAAFALFYDDVQQFLAGNKSVIGELSKTWPFIGETIKGVIQGIGDVWQWFVDLLDGGVSAVTGVAALIVAVWGRVSEVFHQFTAGLANAFPFWALVFKGLGTLLENISGIILDVVGAIAQMLAAMAKFGASALGAIPSLLKSFGGGTHELALSVAGKPAPAPRSPAPGARRPEDQVDAPGRPTPRPNPLVPPLPALVAQTVQQARVAIHTADNTPLAATSPAALAAERGPARVDATVNVNGPITIQSQATDADGIAKDIAGHLKSHIRQAITHHDDGVQS